MVMINLSFVQQKQYGHQRSEDDDQNTKNGYLRGIAGASIREHNLDIYV